MQKEINLVAGDSVEIDGIVTITATQSITYTEDDLMYLVGYHVGNTGINHKPKYRFEETYRMGLDDGIGDFLDQGN